MSDGYGKPDVASQRWSWFRKERGIVQEAPVTPPLTHVTFTGAVVMLRASSWATHLLS